MEIDPSWRAPAGHLDVCRVVFPHRDAFMEEVREPQQLASDLRREFVRLRVERVDLLREGRGLLAERFRRLPCFLRVRDVARDFVPSPPQAVRLGERLAPFRVPTTSLVDELRL